MRSDWILGLLLAALLHAWIGAHGQEGEDMGTKLRIIRGAAEILGVPWAQRMMGELHYAGSPGVEQDAVKALAYFRLAAGKGDSAAQFYMGQYYFQGLGGVEPDSATAMRWFSLAAQNGHMAALQIVAITAKQLGRWQAVVYWLEKGIGYGDSQCMLTLADLYFRDDDGVENDHHRALSLYAQAASKGEPRGMCMQGAMLLLGYGAERSEANLQLAFKQLRRAVDLGYTQAYPWLGRTYAFGEGVEVDMDMANLYYMLYEQQKAEKLSGISD